MSDEVRPYPEYKDSGLPWLGWVPAHWDIRRFKTMLREVNIRSESGKETLLSMTRQRGLVPYKDRTEKVHSARTLIGYKICHVGEIVMNRMQAWSGMFHVAPEDGLVSPDYAVFSPLGDVSTVFLGHLLRSPRMVAKFHTESKGIGSGFLRLYGDRLGAIHAVLPPQQEQKRIESFIGQCNRQVRRFIRNRRQLIEVLNEQKQAIINRAVTRGLDPNVPHKPSGIDWLGDIPTHWEPRRIKQVSKLLRGKFTHRPRNDPSLYDGPYPFIQTGDVSRAAKHVVSYSQTLNENGFAVSKQFPAGTLCMTIAANIGDVAILDFEACFPDSIIGLAPTKGLSTEYLYYAMRAMKPQFVRIAPVTAQGNLNVERVGAMSLALPPIHEQQAIAEYIIEATRSTDKAIATATREIDLIIEYRTRLISDVVTGKVDVRHLAPPPGSQGLEEAVESLEPLGEDIADAVIDEEERVNEAD